MSTLLVLVRQICRVFLRDGTFISERLCSLKLLGRAKGRLELVRLLLALPSFQSNLDPFDGTHCVEG
jgi:hypothetical protein